MHDPGDLAHFIQTGAGIDGQHRPVEKKGARQGKGDGDAPHGDRQAVHVKEGISASVKDAVDGNSIDTAADHVDGHDDHHSSQVAAGLIGEDDKADYERRHGQDQGSGKKADGPGDISELDAVALSLLELAGAQFIAHHDAGCAADTVTAAADQVSDYGRDCVGRGGIRAHMADDGGIGSQTHAPEQVSSQQGKGLPGEVHGQCPAARHNAGPGRADILLSGKDQQAGQQFQEAGKGGRKRRSAGIEGRQTQESEDQDGVEDDVEKDCSGADGGAFFDMVRDLHDHQVALRNAGHEVGPARDPQIVDADLYEFRIRRKNMHQGARKEFAGNKKEDGDQAAEAQHEVKEIPEGLPVSFSVILGAKNGARGGDCIEKYVLDKLDLGRHGDGCHLRLGDAAQHHGVRCRHRCQHQVLQGDRQRQVKHASVKDLVFRRSHKQVISLSE